MVYIKSLAALVLPDLRSRRARSSLAHGLSESSFSDFSKDARAPISSPTARDFLAAVSASAALESRGVSALYCFCSCDNLFCCSIPALNWP